MTHIDLASAPASGDFESDDLLTVEQGQGSVSRDRILDVSQLVQFDASPIGENDGKLAKFIGAGEVCEGPDGLLTATNFSASASTFPLRQTKLARDIGGRDTQ